MSGTKGIDAAVTDALAAVDGVNLEELQSHIARYVRMVVEQSDINGIWGLLHLAHEGIEAGYGTAAESIVEGCRRLLPAIADAPTREQALGSIEGLIGRIAIHRGEWNSALAALSEAQRIAISTGNRSAEALANQLLGIAYLGRNEYDLSRESSERALELYAADHDHIHVAQVNINLANLALDVDDLELASHYLEVAEAEAYGPGSADLRTSIVGTKATIARELDDLELAGKLFRQALERARRSKSVDRIRIAAQNLGSWYSETGNPRRAARLLSEAASLAAVEGNQVLSAGLGRACAIQLLSSGKVDAAIAFMTRAREISLDAGDQRGAAEARADLGVILHAKATDEGRRGHTEEADADLRSARDHMVEARAFFAGVRDESWLDRITSNLILVNFELGEPQEALELIDADLRNDDLVGARRLQRLQDAEAIAMEVGDPALVAAYTQEAGRVARTIDEVDDYAGDRAEAWELGLGAARIRELRHPGLFAVLLMREAVALSESDETLWSIMTSDLGGAYADADQADDAVACFEAVRQRALARSDRIFLARSLGNLGEMARRAGSGSAIDLLNQATGLSLEIGDIEEADGWLLNLAFAQLERNDPEAAAEALDRINDPTRAEDEFEGRVSAARGNVEAAQEDFVAASARYVEAAEAMGDPVERLGWFGRALWAEAKAGRNAEFRRLLDRTEREAIRRDQHGRLAEVLVEGAAVWARSGSIRLASRVYSDAIVAGLNQASRDVVAAAEDYEDEGQFDEPRGGEERVTVEAETSVATENIDEAIPRWFRPIFNLLAKLVLEIVEGGSAGERLRAQVVDRLTRVLPSNLLELVLVWLEAGVNALQSAPPLSELLPGD